jgi:hypothetical protein
MEKRKDKDMDDTGLMNRSGVADLDESGVAMAGGNAKKAKKKKGNEKILPYD